MTTICVQKPPLTLSVESQRNLKSRYRNESKVWIRPPTRGGLRRPFPRDLPVEARESGPGSISLPRLACSF